MASYPRNYPFYNWIPKPLGILILVLLFIPILTVGGVYTANSGEMMSGLGIQSEHIQFVGFLTSIGMAAFSPFFYELICIRREKMMCLVGFTVMYVLSYVCAKTDSIFLLALCSLIMGFLRMVLMMVNLFTLIKYAFGMEATRNITPGNEPRNAEGWDRLDSEKSVSMPTIYLFFMILGQIGTSLTAWLAYEYEWQYVYYYMMAMTLVAILVIFITMPYHRYPGRCFPINFRKFGSVVIFCAMCTSVVYVLVYGKVLDWYDNSTICWATASAFFFTGLFVYMEATHRSPYFLMDIFRLRTINLGIVLFLLLMILNSSALFVNVFTGVGMKIDNWQNAALNNWAILGYFIGAVIAITLGKRGVHLKYLFALGFVFIGLSALFMYFGTYEIPRHHPCHGHDAALLVNSCTSQPAHALQIPVHVDLHHAHRTHDAGARHRHSPLHQRDAAPPAALHHPSGTRHRPALSRNGRQLHGHRPRYDVSGQEPPGSRTDGRTLHQRQGAGTGYAGIGQGNVGLDALCLPGLRPVRTADTLPQENSHHRVTQREPLICTTDYTD